MKSLASNVEERFFRELSQWRSQTFIFGGAKRTPKARDPLGGSGGACTPAKILKSRVPAMRFQAFGGEILQNSEDYKVHRRRNFSQTFLIFYSELNKLEKSP